MRKEKVKQFIHLAAGLLMLLHSFQAFEKEDTKTSFTFLGLAFVILLVSGVHLWLARKMRKADGYIFLIEALVLYYSAWKYEVKDEQYMIVISAIAATLYLWYALYLLTAKKHRHRKGRRRSGSSRSNPDLN